MSKDKRKQKQMTKFLSQFAALEDNYTKLVKVYEADGTIYPQEQKSLNKAKRSITKIKAKLAKLGYEVPSQTTLDQLVKELDGLLTNYQKASTTVSA